MTTLDYLVLIIMAISIITGALTGIVKGTIAIVSAIAGLAAAVYFYPYAGRLLSAFARPGLADLLGFLFVYLVVMGAGALLAWWLRGLLKRLRMGWADRVLGAQFGLVRGWLICSTLYLALTAFPVWPEAVQRAKLAPMLLEGTRAIALITSHEMRERFHGGYTTIKELWERSSAMNWNQPDGADS